jgi:hypothetical protein
MKNVLLPGIIMNAFPLPEPGYSSGQSRMCGTLPTHCIKSTSKARFEKFQMESNLVKAVKKDLLASAME